MGYPKWAAECAAARQISDDSTVVPDSHKSVTSIEPSMEEAPTTELTVPPDEWINELFSAELPDPPEIDVQTKTETIQPTQADSPKQSRRSAQKSKTEILRDRCSDHGIQWQSARADGKPLTKSQMIDLLQQKQVDLSDIIPNAKPTQAA